MKSGILAIRNYKEHEHGFYELGWSYKGSKFKPSTFFPAHWTRAQVIRKVHEAIKNLIADPALEGDRWILHGKITEDITIRMVVDKITGRTVSAYPDFKDEQKG